jgi:hypothetical protein
VVLLLALTLISAASNLSVPAATMAALVFRGYVLTTVPNTSGHRLSKSTSRCSPRSSKHFVTQSQILLEV